MTDPLNPLAKSPYLLNQLAQLIKLNQGAWLCRTLLDNLLVDFGPYWTIFDQFRPIWTILSVWTRLSGPVYLDLYFWTSLFGPVYLVPSIWTCLFAPSIWTGLFALDPFIWIRLLGPVSLNPPIWTCLFGSLYLNSSI